MRVPEPENPDDKRVLELRSTSAITGQTNISRIVIILPSTRYDSHIKQGWADITGALTPEGIGNAPISSIFDGA